MTSISLTSMPTFLAVAAAAYAATAAHGFFRSPGSRKEKLKLEQGVILPGNPP